jgi:nicotinamide mononucleotide transporter
MDSDSLSATFAALINGTHLNAILEWGAAALGLTGIYLNTRGRSIGWWFDIGAAALGGWLYLRSQIYGQMWLQGFFILVSLYGFWRWRRSQRASAIKSKSSESQSITQQRPSNKKLAPYLLAFVGLQAFWVIWLWPKADVATNVTMGSAILDSFVTALSMVAQLMLAQRLRLNWLLWMVVNAASVVLYGISGLYVFMGLYALYFGLALRGWLAWAVIPYSKE